MEGLKRIAALSLLLGMFGSTACIATANVKIEEIATETVYIGRWVRTVKGEEKNWLFTGGSIFPITCAGRLVTTRTSYPFGLVEGFFAIKIPPLKEGEQVAQLGLTCTQFYVIPTPIPITIPIVKYTPVYAKFEPVNQPGMVFVFPAKNIHFKKSDSIQAFKMSTIEGGGHTETIRMYEEANPDFITDNYEPLDR